MSDLFAELEKVFYSLPEVCIARTAAVSGVTLTDVRYDTRMPSIKQTTNTKKSVSRVLSQVPTIALH